MKDVFKSAVFLVLVLTGCNASLPEEQRKALREEMDQREIKKVNENEIFRKALQIGREIAGSMDSVAVSALENDQEVKIEVIDLRDSLNLNETERKILLAYAYAPDPAIVEDNIQKQGIDSLIYSTFVGGDSLRKILLIKMARKKAVLAL